MSQAVRNNGPVGHTIGDVDVPNEMSREERRPAPPVITASRRHVAEVPPDNQGNERRRD